MAILNLVTNVLLFAALAALIGVVVTRWWIVPPSRAELTAPSARIGLAAGGAFLGALVLVLIRQLLEFRDPYAPWSEDLALLLGTSWGEAWMGAGGLGLVGVAAFARARTGNRAAWIVASLAVLVAAVFPALTGHANGGALKRYTLPADIVHVLAMGSWIGSLAVVLLLDRRATRSVLPDLIPRFSPVAMGSVALLGLSGAVGAWAHLGGPADLYSTPYGRWLVRKLALVAGVLVVGAVNFRRRLPRLGRPGGPSALRQTATLEVALAVAVLAATAVLVRTPPG